MMLSQSAARVKQAYAAQVTFEPVLIETRFGTFEFTQKNTILMPQGLIGFAEYQVWGLANLPDPVPEDFKLLQSLDTPPLSLIVMPATTDAAPIDPADLEEACQGAEIDLVDARLLFVCTIRQRGGAPGIDMTANLRAPIILDVRVRQARQHVFSTDRYSLRQPLDRWDGHL